MKQLGWICLTMSACVSLVRAADEASERRQTVAYVRALQGPDGGFYGVRPQGVARGPGGTSLPATLAALRALKYFGGAPRDEKACMQFVERCRDAASGGFANRPGGIVDPTSTALGIMTAVELTQPLAVRGPAGMKYLGEHATEFEQIRLAAAAAESLSAHAAQTDAWLDKVRHMENADGTFGKGDGAARDTASALVTILRLGGTLTNRPQVLKALRDGQRVDGGFGKEGAVGSDLETCYRVMRAFAMLRTKPAAAEKLRQFVARCRNADGGYGVRPSEPSNVSATYNAAIILHWLGQE